MWTDLIKRIDPQSSFYSPATNEQVSKAENTLGIKLPTDLYELILESNGVYDSVWTLERIIENNIFYRTFSEYREIFMPFDHLLFFADAGNGDLFGYAILAGEVRRNDIFAWNHEDDTRKWVASSLKDYLIGWKSGQISL